MRRALYLFATVLAIASLVWLGWSAWRSPESDYQAVTSLTLHTAGAPVNANDVGIHVALRGVVGQSPDVVPIPDTAFLRRTFPNLRSVRIVGDGVDRAQARALEGLHVQWQAPIDPFKAPALTHLSVPRTVSLGQSLRVEGRMEGLAKTETYTLHLEGPDGKIDDTFLKADANGSATFSLTSAPTTIPGRGEWKLRVGSSTEAITLGVVVDKPNLPRVLLLAASPNTETARLHRWLATAGGAATSRVKVSAEHYRSATTPDSPPEVPIITRAAVEKFDVIVATESALLALETAELKALEDSIRLEGLGLIVTGEPAGTRLDGFFSPWTIAGKRPEPDAETRSARLRFADGTEFAEPALLLDGELPTLPLSAWIARDTSGRTVAAALPRGRGKIVRTLVIDTWRWLQGGHAATFASFWSDLLSQATRPRVNDQGLWSIEGNELLFPNEPVKLGWSGDEVARPSDVQITTESLPVAPPVTVQLARSANRAGVGEATFWPSRPGWHRVRAGQPDSSVTALSFYVQSTADFSGVQVAQHRQATEALVALSVVADEANLGPSPNHVSRGELDWLAFTVFVASASHLWFVHRRALLQPTAPPR